MLTLYVLRLSPPALKVLYVANYLGLEYKEKGVNLKAGEGQSPEYKKIHPVGKVPAMVDGDFALFESAAITRYLADKENSDIYPKGLKERAVVDQWTDFVCQHIQNGVSRAFWNKVVAPLMGQPSDEASMKCGFEFIARFFPIVEEQLSKHTYLAGDKISLADFHLVAQTDPVVAIGVDMSLYPNFAKYREEMQQQDWYQKVHKVYGESVLAGNS